MWRIETIPNSLLDQECVYIFFLTQRAERYHTIDGVSNSSASIWIYLQAIIIKTPSKYISPSIDITTEQMAQKQDPKHVLGARSRFRRWDTSTCIFSLSAADRKQGSMAMTTEIWRCHDLFISIEVKKYTFASAPHFERIFLGCVY